MPSRCRFLLIALAMLLFLSAAGGPGMAGTWKFELDFRDHPSLSYSEDGKLIFVLACGRAFGLHAKYPGKAEKSGTATIVLRNGRTAMKFVGELGEAGGNDLTDFEQWDLGFSRQDPELYGKRWKRLRSRLLDLIAAAAPLTISNGRESYDLPKVDAPNWRGRLERCGR